MLRKTERCVRQRLHPPEPMQGTRRQIAWAREIYRRLLGNYTRIAENCDVLALLTPEMDGRTLAEWYLDHLARRQRRAAWWIVHRNELTAAWFMSDYIQRYLNGVSGLAECCHLESEVREEALLCPEEAVYPGAVELIMENDVHNRLVGHCLLRYERNAAFTSLAHEMNMTWEPRRSAYVRRIDGVTGPLDERCAEIGSKLLLAGFRILVLDEEVRTMICTGAFGWEHGRWILPGSTPTRLKLIFPNDKLLYQRALTLGAYWTGRSVEINVWHADDLVDFARLYDFRISDEARRLLEKWQDMCLRGRTVHPKEPPRDACGPDPVSLILENDAPVPEDLVDED